MRFFTFECHSGLTTDGVQLTRVGDSLSLALGEQVGKDTPPRISVSSSKPPAINEDSRLLKGSLKIDYGTNSFVLEEEDEADRFQVSVLVFSSPTREVLEASPGYRHGVVKRFKTSEILGIKGFGPVFNLDGVLVDKYAVELLILSPGDCAIIRPYGVPYVFSKGHKTIACSVSEGGEMVAHVGPFKDHKRFGCQHGDVRFVSFHMRGGNGREEEVSSL